MTQSRLPMGLAGMVLMVLALVAGNGQVRLHAQATDRFLGKADILLYGFGLRVEPAHQVVPRDIATIVSVFLGAGTQPQGDVPPFAPDALVKGTLYGPGYPNGLDLTTKPNTPFNIPPIGVAGLYTFENIRLESGGEILMRGIPESVSIEVIEQLLVTQVTARALTAQEVREKGIVFDSSNFQAYNFTAAFALQDSPVRISFPVVLPLLAGAQNATTSTVDLASVPGATLPQLTTIIPDTLKLQTQIPNLQVVGFTLKVPNLQGQQLVVPPIPGVVVIPGDIGFLNQFFSVMLLVGNVAPPGSNLSVSDLRGEILLPAGIDTVVNSGDDPLAMANTTGGESPRTRLVVQPGPDGKLGTADDIATIGPGESGSAEYLVEGRREGNWDVEFNITGTLNGLPGGPVTVTGRAAGAVVVRNPNFTLTFTHPSTVAAGEKYTLDVTVTNTSASPANFVSVSLFGQNLSGASLVGDPVRTIESVPPGDSATVSFDLIARVTGKVTAATLDTDEKVQGRFALKSAVGELGVPVSPDSLVLPAEAGSLPLDLRTAVLGMLGKAWAVATAPNATLPVGVQRFSKKIVYDRAVAAAEAGFRIALHEPIPDSAAQLEMDFAGSDFLRLASQHPDPADLQFTQWDFAGFDALRRASIRGDVLASAVGALLAPEVAARGAAAFHQAFAEKTAYRPAQLSVLVSGEGGPLAFDASLVDAQGRHLGGVDASGKVTKEIPYSDLLPLVDSTGATTAQMLLLVAPDAGQYHLQFTPRAGATAAPMTVSIVVPDLSGGMRQVVYTGVTAASSPTSPFGSSDPYSVVLDLPLAGGPSPLSPTLVQPVVPPLPHLLGVVQQADKDLDAAPDEVGDPRLHQLGRIIAVLFDQEVTPQSAQDRQPRGTITNYSVDGNSVVGVALQPGRRIAFLALRDPIGPFVPRQLTITGVTDARGRSASSPATPIEMTVTRAAAVLAGQVIEADGNPVPNAEVRLLIRVKDGFLGVSAKTADADGRFTWDWAPAASVDRIVAVNPATGDQRTVDFTVQRDGQRLNINVVFLGRGMLTGRTIAEDGTPVPNTDIAVTSLTDQSQYGARSDAQGRYFVPRVPVGSVLIQAVNVLAKRKGTVTELIPFAGATVTRDVRMFDVTSPTIVVKVGTLTGHVLRGDGVSVVGDVPVVAYYQANSQVGVACPNPLDFECAVAVARTDASGRFVMENITAGQLRLVSFEQSTFQQGDARTTLPANGTSDVNILFSQGLGTVNGVVLDADGNVVAGARVGGGLSLTTTDQAGRFSLVDVPVGRRDIVAVSDLLATKGVATVDILTAGQSVNVTVVLVGTASIAGTVFRADGTTPVPNNKVYLFYATADGINVAASAVTDAAGRYRILNVPLVGPSGGTAYQLSSFRSDFSDGNVKPVALNFNNQVFRGDIVFRGGGGTITGHVFDSNGTTPLRAAVGVSGDQVLVAGGLVGTGFKHVSNYQVTTTDFATGSFSFNKVFVGPFTVSAAGQFSPDPINVEGRIQSPNQAVQVDVRLQATSTVQGTVFLPDGVTPAGPNVVLHYASSAVKLVCATSNDVTVGTQTVPAGECAEIPQGIQNETAVTDADGRFLVPLVNAGAFTITAEDAATGRTGQVLGTVRPGQAGEFSIRLLGRSALRINVRGSNAITPIPGASVSLKQIGFPNKTLNTVVDAQGTLLLDGGDQFTEGEVVALALDQRNGFTGRGSARITTDGGVVTLNIYLFDAVGSVFGVVRKPDGLTPVPNAEVVITKCGSGAGVDCQPAGALAFAVTDASGAYAQDNMPLGAFRVDVFEAATARLGSAAGSIDFAGQPVQVDIVEAGRGIVTGAALAAGSLAPLVNWEVTLFQFMPGGRQIELKTASDVDGTFAFPGTTVGTFRVYAYRGENRLQPDLPFGSAQVVSQLQFEGQQVEVPVIVPLNQRMYGTVSGVVFNVDGTPATNVTVALCPGCDVDLTAPQSELFAVTGADGTFTFDRVLIGRFTMLAKSQTSLNAGRGAGELFFSGDAANLTITLTGLGRISGRVEYSDGRVVPTARLTLYGQPSSGCTGSTCTAFTDAAGEFTFINVPARTFWMTATDAVSGLSGTISGVLNSGTPLSVRLVLQPTAAVSGRVLFERGTAAAGVTAELDGSGANSALHLFRVSDADGQFQFPAVPVGAYTLNLQDPLGPGVARRLLQVSAGLAIGDIALDESAPSVKSTTPAASASGVPLNSTVKIVFSERVSAATVTQVNIVIAGPSGPVLGTLALTDTDTAALFTPLAPLAEKTRYVVSVQNVADLVGKRMSAYSSSLTTADLTAPTIADLTPAVGGRGIALATTVRVKYSEPINPARFRGPPVQLLKGGVLVDGRTDFIFGNTTVVFTPTLPLDANTPYLVQVEAATDLSDNAQPQALSYQFFTFDQTPPRITGLTAAGNGSVIENAITQVVATVDAGHDVSVVDFYVNDAPAFAARTAPYTLTLQAGPSYGAPGDSITVSAFATDTSGTRSLSAVSVLVPIVADAPPAVSITTPAPGTAFRTGDRVTVTVRSTDDLGSTQIAYRAQTGNPVDAATAALAPAAADATRSFAFIVARDAVPGSSIIINGSATDTKGQTAAATPVAITVVDATLPTVTITGTTSGARVSPGQQTSAIVLAEDLGGIAGITFTTGGVVVGTETRSVNPAQNAVAASFSFTVPTTARPGETLAIDATAVDAAGNTGVAARVLLPVADLNPPQLTLRTSTGSLFLVPGTSATALVDATDDTAVASASLQGQGAFSFSTAKPVSPPSNSAQLSFLIPVPADAVEGATLNVSARGTDVFGNISAPVTLALTVRATQTVSLPASLIVAAGDTAAVQVQLGTPAGPGGVRVDLQTDLAGVAIVEQSIQFAEGQTTATATVSGLAGGITTLTAQIGGVPRAAMTVTVRGGIVSGVVLDDRLVPVAGANVSVASIGFGALTTTSDASGRFTLENVGGGFFTRFTVRASDPVTRFIGYESGSLSGPGGFAHVNVVLVSAGSIAGSVTLTDGATPAGTGAKVDLFKADQPTVLLGTTFTDAAGSYEFPVVSLGSYFVEASDVTGNRGRSAIASLTVSGQQLRLDIGYLGRGSVTGIVRDSAGNAASNIPITLDAASLFGQAPRIQGNALADGTFRVDNVFIGTFRVQARDPISNFAGTASGSILQDGQVVTADIVLAPWGALEGTVYRADGVTPVAGAQVGLSSRVGLFETTTDTAGHYSFTFVPLGSYSLDAREVGTGATGRVYNGTPLVDGQTVTQDIVFFAEGTLVVTVRDGLGALVPGAAVNVQQPLNGSLLVYATTDANGVALFEHILASPGIVVSASSGTSNGSSTITLLPDEVKPVTVTFVPTGSIGGTVFLPDGQSPAASGTVTACGFGCVSAPVNPDGSYRIDGLRLRSWVVTLADAANRTRAIVRDVTIATVGQLVTQNLTMAGLGSVTGRVVNPDTSSASNQTVVVQSLDPDLGGFVNVVSNAAGFYRADNLIVGAIVASAGDKAKGLLGEARGQLARDGDTLVLDILLKNNAITLPVRKSDANFFSFDVQPDGSLLSGYNYVFGADCCPLTQGAMYLDVIANGTPTRFLGSAIGTTEDFGRQVVVSQDGVAGLNVTRKILVSNAYFARYLEVLTNPTNAPLTVDLHLQGKVKAGSLFATSSGDAALDVSDSATADRWMMFNEPPYDPLTTSAYPQVGVVFDGASASTRAAGAVFAPAATNTWGQFDYGWDDITIQPGQTVAFMHFVVQQYNREAAQASLERLAQLPPESMESLSPQEIAAIANFAVPADATSPLAPLPALGGTITGGVFESDGTTPVVSQKVTLRSTNIYFGRAYRVGTDTAARFTFGGANVTVPLAGFTVEAEHPRTRVTSRATAAQFTSGLTTANADVIFSNTGIVRGTVSRTSGQVVSGATISAVTVPAGNFGVTFANSAGDGSYSAPGLPAGTFSLTASIPQTQGQYGGSLFGTATTTVVEGQSQTVNLVIEPTGTISGTVRTALGAASPNALMEAVGCRLAGCIVLQTRTDSAGVYRFLDVPVASYSVKAYDPVSNYPASGTVSVAPNQAAVLDLTFVGTGSISVTARFANAAVAGSTYVEVVKPVGPNSTYTDASGRATITGVLPGTFVLRLHHPRNFNAVVDVIGTVTTTGQVVSVTSVLPPVGTLLVQVTSGGSPVQNATVNADESTPGFLQYAGSTDSTGQARLQNLRGGVSVHVMAFQTATQFAGATATITSEGQVLAVPIVINAGSTITGRVLTADAVPVGGVTITLDTTAGQQNSRTTQSQPDGSYVFNDVPTGAFRVYTSFGNRAGVSYGDISSNGGVVTLDLLLTVSSTLVDANGFRYGVLSGGYLSGGAFSYFPQLSVASVGGGSLGYYAGVPVAQTELNGSQLVIQNMGNGVVPVPMQGLTVTRKVYVDPSGYFARVLEIFDNPSATAVAVDINALGGVLPTAVVATSSGTSTVSAADQWFVTNSGGSPAANVALVFAGPNAVLPPSRVQAANTNSLSLLWSTLVVPAGGRAVLMHFAAQAADQATAVAVAQRLVQLPPEAIAGMTASERSAVQNFAVPADGSSPLLPFASVGGRVFGSDSVTPAAGVQVLVTGSDARYFKPTISVQTDGSGRYVARTLPAGPVTVQASDAPSQSLSAVFSVVSDGQTPLVQDVMFTSGGILNGTVRSAKGLPAPGVTVYASNTSGIFVSTVSGADGAYRFASLPAAAYTLQARPADGRSTVVYGVGVTTGNVTNQDLTLDAIASVRVTITQSGVPAAGWTVAISGRRTTTNSAGAALIPNVPVGPFTVQIYQQDSSASLSLQGEVRVEDDGGIVDVLAQVLTGTARGTVRAGDGTTVVPGAVVYVYDGSSTSPLTAGYANASGDYQFTNLVVTGPFRLVAHGPSTLFDVTAEATASFATSTLATVNLTLPIGVVRGTVVEADGVTGVYSVPVTFSQEKGDGTAASQGGYFNSEFTFFAKTGIFDVEARKQGIYASRVTGTLADITQAQTVLLRMPAFGSVTGIVRDANGVPQQSATVFLESAASTLYGSVSTTTNFNGAYTIDQVAVGGFSVQACLYDNGWTCGTGAGRVGAAGTQATLNISVPGTGALTGQVFASDGTTPQPGVQVSIAPLGDGPSQYLAQNVATDATGGYTFTRVPAGPVRVTALDPSYIATGQATVTVVAGSTTTLNLTSGTAGPCQTSLVDVLSFRFDTTCAGELNNGGTTNGQLSNAYDTAYSLRVNGQSPIRAGAVVRELGGRQLVYGPFGIGGVTATRKLFVPATGNFARYLDTLTNPTATSLTVDVQVESALNGIVRVLVDPAITGTYAITAADPTQAYVYYYGYVTQNRPALGHVFGPLGAPAHVDAVRFQRLLGTSTYHWTVTLAPGQSMTFMHFAFMHDPADILGADAQAHALVDLTDPDALAGMTPAEKAAVVNYVIP